MQLQAKKLPAGSRSLIYVKDPTSLTTRNKLRVFYVNARSLRNKFSELEEIAFTDNYDIIRVTESWLNLQNRDFLAKYNIPGYVTFEKSRVNKHGGGVVLYIKDSLNPILLSKPIIPNVDTLFILLNNHSGKKLAIVLAYRPPAQPVQTDSDLFDQISEISDTHEAVIMGDFNLPTAKWGASLTSHHGHELYSNLKESSLTQFVQSPTRNNHILDLVFGTNEDLIDKLEVGEEFCNSDHRAITFSINFMSKEANKSEEKVPDFRKGNFCKLKSMLSKIDWSQLCTIADINAKWKMFTDKYLKAVQECVPMKTRRATQNVKVKPQWWNKHIAECLRAKRGAHNRYKNSRNSDDRTKFVEIRRKARLIKHSNKRSTEPEQNEPKSIL